MSSDPPNPKDTADANQVEDRPPKELENLFKFALLNKENTLNGQYLNFDNGKAPLIPTEPGDMIILSDADKARIYAPWRSSVIVKIFKKKN